jgi:hypothetical protein
VGEDVLDCKGGGQEKWSSGLREALLTDHNGDVPNGYAWQACTPLRRWCNRILILAIHPDRIPILATPILAIPILAIPILAIPILAVLILAIPVLAIPILAMSSRNLTTDILKKSAKNARL